MAGGAAIANGSLWIIVSAGIKKLTPEGFENHPVLRLLVHFVLVLLGAGVSALLLERGPVKIVARESRIVSAGIVEELRRASAVMIIADLHRSPHSIFQLVVRIDGDFLIAFLGFFVLGDNHTSHQ